GRFRGHQLRPGDERRAPPRGPQRHARDAGRAGRERADERDALRAGGRRPLRVRRRRGRASERLCASLPALPPPDPDTRGRRRSARVRDAGRRGIRRRPALDAQVRVTREDAVNWLVYALLSALFAGLIAVFAKVGMRGIDSTLATTARAVIMAAALVVLV